MNQRGTMLEETMACQFSSEKGMGKSAALSRRIAASGLNELDTVHRIGTIHIAAIRLSATKYMNFLS
jgi:hypothetical protein